MRDNSLINKSTAANLPGFVAWLAIMLWFLITIMASAKADESSVTLKASDILPDIEHTLLEKGMSPDAEIILSTPEQPVSTGSVPTIIHISFNPTSGRFVMRLANGTAVTGVARVSTQFPVLTQSVERGEIITEENIGYIETVEPRTQYFVTDAGDLIGQEARRPLAAGEPLRSADLTTPVLIKKGAIITLNYVLNGLRLSHQGVAMDNGSAGDIITVKNIQSERVLKAVVEQRGLARVAAPNIRRQRVTT